MVHRELLPVPVSFFLFTFIGALTHAAHAQLISGGASMVAGPLVANFAGGTGIIAFNNLAYFFLTRVWLIAGVIAAYNIIRAGIKLINSGEEDKLTKARNTIAISLVAVMALYLAPKLVEAIYSAGGSTGLFDSEARVAAGASVFAIEVYGIIRWIEVIIAPFAVALIVLSGLKSIASFGKEDGPAALRREVLSVGVGILMLLLDPVLKATLGIPPTNIGLPGIPTPAPIIIRAINIGNQLLLFLSLVAVAIVIYAGIQMMVSLGEEETYTKSKGLLTRAAMGFVVLIVSYSLVNLVVGILLS